MSLDALLLHVILANFVLLMDNVLITPLAFVSPVNNALPIKFVLGTNVNKLNALLHPTVHKFYLNAMDIHVSITAAKILIILDKSKIIHLNIFYLYQYFFFSLYLSFPIP